MKKVLIIIDGLWPPVIKSSGMKIVHEYFKRLAENYEIHILTSTTKFIAPNYVEWAKQQEAYNLYFHFIDARRFDFNSFLKLLVGKILFIIHVFKLIRTFKFSLIHEYGSLPILSLVTSFYKVYFKIPAIFTTCTVNTSFLASFRYAWGIKFLDYFTLAGIELTKKTLSCWPQYKEKIKFTPFGVDITSLKQPFKREELLKKFGLPRNKKIYTFIGPLEERKGFFTLIKAVNRIKEDGFFLLIVTYGLGGVDYKFKSHYEQFKKLMKNKNYKVITGNQNVSEILRLTDIFVFPSTSLKGTLAQPLTLLEALSFELPCIVSDLEENKRIVQDYTNGLLFRRKDDESLAVKMEKLLRCNLSDGVSLNFSKFKKEYDISNTVLTVKEIYGNLI
ncbi:MAG: glycosyltransferase family 4 protein [Candidatus Aceula meridiana]|nr:glycosyltransferase family 4 protein [Candidatus Aceula meridiana]